MVSYHDVLEDYYMYMEEFGEGLDYEIMPEVFSGTN